MPRLLEVVVATTHSGVRRYLLNGLQGGGLKVYHVSFSTFTTGVQALKQLLTYMLLLTGQLAEHMLLLTGHLAEHTGLKLQYASPPPCKR